MSKERGDRDTTYPEYERLRDLNLRQKKDFLESLDIESIKESLRPPKPRRTKPSSKGSKTSNEARETPIGRPNLRSRSGRTSTHNDHGAGADDIVQADIVEDNEDSTDTQRKKQKRGRGYTRKEEFWAKERKEKIKLEFNEFGQPIGDDAKELPSVIGMLVRTKGFPLCYDDWREVDVDKKLKIIEILECVFELDEEGEEYILASAAKKWRDFKSDLKSLYFDEEKTDEELMARCDTRVHEDDWAWLINHWRSEKAHTRAEIGKLNRSKLVTPHTAGSKSFARVDHEWSKELGHKPRRDQLFVKTHTRKNGVPLPQALPKINALKEALAQNPELSKKTIKEGDAVSYVFGREPRGHVRCVGLGPTPSSLGMKGHRKYVSTKVQMALHGRHKAEHQVTLLQGTVENLQEEVAELKQFFSEYRQREHTPNGGSTPHGSNNRVVMSEEHEEGREDDDNELESNYPREEEDQIFTNRRVAAPPTRDEEGGKEVLLISLIGASNTRVAKATVQTTDPRAIVGGTALGMQCSEVVVNFVMRRDAPLFRPYGKMETMADAVGQSIAWPNKKMVDVQQFKRSSHHSLGNSQRR